MAERILIVEDDRELRELLSDILVDAGYLPVAVPSAEMALRTVDAGALVDLVIADLMLPGMGGGDLLGEIRRRRPEVPVVTMTAFGSIESAIELVKAGAFDYLTKPLGADELLLTVERALADSRPRRELAQMAREEPIGALPELIGASPPMLELYSLIARAAVSPHAVLVTGESGTGKELVARALHRLSGRGPFVTVNCGALPEQLMESELFGHERGAFTGADRVKEGLFQTADKGTLLLDEIGELPMALQPKLLRAVEQSEIRRVGATQGRMVDVRVVAATNRELETEVAAGRFRDDLYWRLNVLTIHLPPLRERIEDLPRLAERFLARTVGEQRAGQDANDPTGPSPPRAISDAAMAMLRTYHWPGNIRELRNAILRAATLAAGPLIEPDDLPARVRDAERVTPILQTGSQRRLPLSEVERLYILRVLDEVAGNKSKAAEILGLDRKTLYRKLEEYRADDSV